MKHTSGPWQIIESPSGLLQVFTEAPVNQNDESAVLIASCYSNDVNDPAYQANSKLIAAAPELLETLGHAVSALSVAVNSNAFKDCALPNIGEWTLRQCELVIAKAKGEK